MPLASSGRLSASSGCWQQRVDAGGDCGSVRWEGEVERAMHARGESERQGARVCGEREEEPQQPHEEQQAQQVAEGRIHQ